MGALKKQPHKKILHRPTSTGGVAIPQLVGVSLLSLRKDLQSAYPGGGVLFRPSPINLGARCIGTVCLRPHAGP